MNTKIQHYSHNTLSNKLTFQY